MKKNNNFYIICFYSYYKDLKKILIGEIFDPENNFISLDKIEYEDNLYPIYFKCAVNNDESKIYICYTTEGHAFCIYFDIINNLFSTKNKTATSCKIDIFAFNINYCKITEEFIFSCKNFFRNITFSKFDENMNFISEKHEF